jgi:hypothetical protein
MKRTIFAFRNLPKSSKTEAQNTMFCLETTDTPNACIVHNHGSILNEQWPFYFRGKIKFKAVYTRIFHWHNPSGRTRALGLTQSLTEMSTRDISWGWRRPVRRADNFATFMYRLYSNLGGSTPWNPQGLSRPVTGLLYLYILPKIFR